MRRDQRLETRVWVIMGLLTAVACESGSDEPKVQSTPEPVVGEAPEDDDQPIVDEDEDQDEVEPEPADAGMTSLDASTMVDPGPRDTPPDASVRVDAGGTTGPSAAFLRGQALADMSACKSCHQSNYAGLGYFPNITPHPTAGIGAWTDEQIARAITDGVNEKGETLCAGMTRYELTEAQVADLVAFLRGLSPNAKVIAPVCPGHNM